MISQSVSTERAADPWIEAFGAACALLVAAGSYRRFVNNRRREQAAQLSVWCTEFTYDYMNTGESRAKIVVCNGSQAPIYNIDVSLVAWDWPERERYRDSFERLDGRHFGAIAPGQTTEPEQCDAGLQPPPDPHAKGGLNPPYQIEFTDNAGRRCVRRPDGVLPRGVTGAALLRKHERARQCVDVSAKSCLRHAHLPHAALAGSVTVFWRPGSCKAETHRTR